MEAFEFLAASYVLLSGLLVELVQGGIGVFFLIDGLAEVEGNVVHQKAIDRREE